jgi:DNA-binding NtrC family response regulator
MDTRTIVEEGRLPPPPNEGRVLLVMSPDYFATIPLPKSGVLTIGRSTRADIRVEDPVASREHARLHVDDEVRVEDVGSANGTWVRNQALGAGELVTVVPGEGITIANTVLMVQRGGSTVGRRWLWSHAYFESRVAKECAREAPSGGSPFALVRLRFERGVTWPQLAPVFARRVLPPHVFASYGPHDYEVLLVESGEAEATALVSELCADLEASRLPCRCGVALHPKDGRTTDALLARANSLLRPPGLPETPEIGAPSMQRIREMATRAAMSNINILILGETGVGKEVLAQAIHRMSPRANKPLVALNGPSLNDSLLESELFGHERGSFTNAAQTKQGLLEVADHGTVFFDEVGDLPLGVQAKLLRVLETREVKRIGGLKPRSIDVRFIAATNVILEDAVAKGTFRRDLFHRLNAMCLKIPPLRERPEEIRALAEQFVEHSCRDLGRPSVTIDEEVFDLLETYPWPGNIRELKNDMERAVVLCEGDHLLPEHLPLDKLVPNVTPSPSSTARATPPAHVAVPVVEDQAGERERMVQALALNAGNQTRAAAMLGMPRRTFVHKLVRYGIPRPQPRKPSRPEPGLPDSES